MKQLSILMMLGLAVTVSMQAMEADQPQEHDRWDAALVRMVPVGLATVLSLKILQHDAAAASVRYFYKKHALPCVQEFCQSYFDPWWLSAVSSVPLVIVTFKMGFDVYSKWLNRE